MFNWLRKRRRRKILVADLPRQWHDYLSRNVHHYRQLDEPLREHLHDCVQIMVAEKNWEGLDGLEINDEIRVTIAGQASLMLLGTDDYYFDGVKTVLVFPKPFRRKTKSGWVIDEDTHNAGEAWQGGPIVLSWYDVVSGGRNEDDGENLVIHEFAHHLDGIDGEMGGSLAFGDEKTSQQWVRVLKREFAALQDAAERGRRTLLDHYGATSEAEFFAVASETFFELPRELKSDHRELFDLLARYYRIDPITWRRVG